MGQPSNTESQTGLGRSLPLPPGRFLCFSHCTFLGEIPKPSNPGAGALRDDLSAR